MAIFTAGAVVGQISGSIAGNTFSHNRGGPYIRTKSIPVVSTTIPALASKSRLQNATAAFQSLTAAQRLAWNQWAAENPVINRLGNRITLTGHTAYVGNRIRMVQAAETPLVAPPVTPAASALLTMTITADIGTGTTEIAFTPTPLGATERLWVQATVVNSASINYVKNLLRVISIEAAATPGE